MVRSRHHGKRNVKWNFLQKVPPYDLRDMTFSLFLDMEMQLMA